GIEMVGQVATALEIFIFLPVMTMIVIGFTHWHHNPFVPLIPPHQATFKVFGVGLALGLWLYSGYEQLSTVAEEVENPQRAYPRALALVVPLSMAAYFLPTLAGLASAGNWEKWHTGFFSDAAAIIGGTFHGKPWLGTWMTLAAMVGNVALLNSTVLTTLSAWKLRRTQPELKRSFTIPGGRAGLLYVVGAPVVMAMVALLGSDRFGMIGGAIAIVAGPAVYGIIAFGRR